MSDRRTPPTIAQVVPALPTYAVDDGFSYAIPEGMRPVVGSIVRVPLGGRRVRGYVISVRAGDASALKPIVRISGAQPVFDARLLESLRATAIHYVAPLSVVLARAAPPNLPSQPGTGTLGTVSPAGPSPLPGLTADLSAGRHGRSHLLLGRAPWHETVTGLAGPVLAAGRSVLVVLPTTAEMHDMAARLEGTLAERLVVGSSGEPADAVTTAWSRAALEPGHIVVGTREIVFWPVADLALAVMVGDGRRGMKDKGSPTIHAREVLRRRAGVERFSLVLAGSVPTTDALAAGLVIARAGGTRIWPLVEVVDRNEEPPGRGFLTSRAMAAVRTVARRGGRVFVFSHRRGYAPAFRCSRCRTVRLCGRCGARADRSAACSRCEEPLGPCLHCGGASFEPLGAGVERIAEELARSVVVGPAGSDAPVWVGTERDLPSVADVELAVVVDADGVIGAPNYRAGEDALRLFARVAETVGSGSGRRCIIQTTRPGDPVIRALRHGDPIGFLEETIAERALTQLPPVGEVLVVELDSSGDADGDIRALATDRATVFGPAAHAGRYRWLVQGANLRPFRIGLRRLVHGWRERGRRVRIDVDPIDL